MLCFLKRIFPHLIAQIQSDTVLSQGNTVGKEVGLLEVAHLSGSGTLQPTD